MSKFSTVGFNIITKAQNVSKTLLLRYCDSNTIKTNYGLTANKDFEVKSVTMISFVHRGCIRLSESDSLQHCHQLISHAVCHIFISIEGLAVVCMSRQWGYQIRVGHSLIKETNKSAASKMGASNLIDGALLLFPCCRV